MDVIKTLREWKNILKNSKEKPKEVEEAEEYLGSGYAKETADIIKKKKKQQEDMLKEAE